VLCCLLKYVAFEFLLVFIIERSMKLRKRASTKDLMLLGLLNVSNCSELEVCTSGLTLIYSLNMFQQDIGMILWELDVSNCSELEVCFFL